MNYLKQALFLSIVLLAFSCKDDNGPGIDAGSGKVTVTIDGMSFESKDEVDGAVFVSTQGSNLIQAYAEDGAYLGLTLFGNLSSGQTLETTGGFFQANYKPDFNEDEAFQAVGGIGSGTTTITNFSDSNITGTFQFTAVKINPDGSQEERVFTNGSYDIDF